MCHTQRPEQGIESPAAGVANSCELSVMGARNGSQVLYRPMDELKHLSIPEIILTLLHCLCDLEPQFRLLRTSNFCSNRESSQFYFSLVILVGWLLLPPGQAEWTWCVTTFAVFPRLEGRGLCQYLTNSVLLAMAASEIFITVVGSLLFSIFGAFLSSKVRVKFVQFPQTPLKWW